MDLLRSCYTTTMRFFKDNPLEIKVRWYWCADQAELFPFHTLFGSGNWASDRFDWPGPGEVLGAERVWNNGEFIDGMLGDHHCGPDQTYREGGTFPGVPLNGLPDGRCACCNPLPPACADLVGTLPDMLRLRILNITVVPDTAPASQYVIGQEFDVPLGSADPRAWFIDPPPRRDFCPFSSSFGLGCGPTTEGTQLVLNNIALGVQNVPTLIDLLPFRAYYSFVNISNGTCSATGFGDEFWDVVIFDPANPPP